MNEAGPRPSAFEVGCRQRESFEGRSAMTADTHG